jgi:hypothetical protein
LRDSILEAIEGITGPKTGSNTSGVDQGRRMLAKVKSGALLGVDAYIVEVEVDLAPGLPAFTTVYRVI